MVKISRISRKRDPINAALVIKTADITRLSIRQVYRVIDGGQMNADVLKVFMALEELEEQAFITVKNNLLKKVEELVPFS